MTNVQKAEATLKCTRCGHSVPPPADSTSDETNNNYNDNNIHALTGATQAHNLLEIIVA